LATKQTLSAMKPALPWTKLRSCPAPRLMRALRGRPGGFTLIELILVMALLLIVAGVTFPSLRNFFQGRSLDSEARRFLALTRYAQSRAVAEGIPMVLWVDAREKTYGLQTETGYVDTDSKAIEFPLAEDLQLEVSAPPVAALVSPRTRAALQSANVPAIRFWPDGSIGETSPEYVRLQETRTGHDSTLWVAQTANRHGYEIRDTEPPIVRR
jgi:type II secretion system protein H